MILHVKKKAVFVVALTLLAVTFYVPRALAQQGSLSLTVTPPFFQLTASPGETWTSSIKVVNTNPYDLTVYATPVRFEAEGEAGNGRFVPIIDDNDADKESTLARWISISGEPVVIPEQESRQITFSVNVPEDAPPGGHYAAILIGPRAIGADTRGSSVSISSLVTSLLFLRVPGDVLEEGDIREFTTGQEFYSSADVTFALRFENIGNVHLQPQGDITIYNMFGKKRGVIPINQKTDFGNVLPGSVRQFDFEWKSDGSIFDAGRYKAIATVAFGSDARQNATSAVYFWILPIKPTLAIFGGLLLIIILTFGSIRIYVRRSLAAHQKRLGFLIKQSRRDENDDEFHEDVIDLRKFSHEDEAQDAIQASPYEIDISGNKKHRGILWFLARTIRRYAVFFTFISIFILGVVGVAVYFAQILGNDKSFDVVVHQGDEVLELSSEEIIREELTREAITPEDLTGATDEFEEPANDGADADTRVKEDIIVHVLNGGGISGAAAKTAVRLEEEGFVVERVGNAESFGFSHTFVRYRPGHEKHAEELAEILYEGVTIEELIDLGPDILIIIGKDFSDL